MTNSSHRSNLQLSPQDMRDLGHEVVELLVSHFESLPDQPVSNTASRPQMEALFRETPPEDGMPWAQVLKRVKDDVFSHMMHVDHPRFLSFVSSPSNFVGAMADALVSGMNVFAGTWMEAAGPA
ncbi:MAG: decarboxylase, partial [Candidatus Latescibacteria bacterium]|nr:decarboxylase [Candidatus Latescibacterota bacterium]